jgi:hypothetical protein
VVNVHALIAVGVHAEGLPRDPRCRCQHRRGRGGPGHHPPTNRRGVGAGSGPAGSARRLPPPLRRYFQMSTGSAGRWCSCPEANPPRRHEFCAVALTRDITETNHLPRRPWPVRSFWPLITWWVDEGATPSNSTADGRSIGRSWTAAGHPRVTVSIAASETRRTHG